MPVPEFVAALRRHVGHAPLWLSGVSVVVRDDDGRLLLTRRADNGRWAVVSGVLEPGEEPGPRRSGKYAKRPASTRNWSASPASM